MSHLLRKAALSAIGGSLLVATLGLAPASAEQPDAPPGQAQAAEQATPAGHTDEQGRPTDPGKPADRHDPAPGHDHDGDADSSGATSYTEDDDTNDGGTPNNVADEGDNAHPSGRDRSVENGSGGNQGRSESDPDDDGRGPDRTNGGADKPDGPGGEDLADQDGNNGCGNDDDFEDDNEGWCGKPADTEPEAQSAAQPAQSPVTKPCPDGSMTRPCHVTGQPAADVQAEAEVEVEATITTADAAEHRAGFTCPAGDAAGHGMPAFCRQHVAAVEHADEDEDEAVVLGSESSRGRAAGAEASDSGVDAQSTVSARSAGGALVASLANVPVVGSVIEGQLPVTGSGLVTFLLVALASTVLGLVLLRAARRTEVDATS